MSETQLENTAPKKKRTRSKKEEVPVTPEVKESKEIVQEVVVKPMTKGLTYEEAMIKLLHKYE